ncbi:serine/threonine-protein kinase [Streptosporangium sp. NPDC049376]|uniref:serine/threonine-protein kinase n=1 Tax=Streptosporangium sp. NPDC049376 TaxID=3366192 RepID=UPI003794CC61
MDANRPGVEGLRPGDPGWIGEHRLLGRLGEGGMGTVYLARNPQGRLVAVKVIKPEVAVEDGFAERFHAEVRNARRVASFCTAQVLGNGNADDGRPYMVTEYIPGTPLSRQISVYGALDPAQLHGVALGVAAALAAIHVAGLVHRDLKPANVILSLSGPRVIDFGVARALDSTRGFTRSGEVLGSPGWWAPEQVKGLEITPAADVFAWGCLIAYAGNGRHPYGRGDMITMATRLLNTPPDLGSLPAPLDDLVRRATAMDPGARPTAQDLLIALVGGSPAPAGPLTAGRPAPVVDVLGDTWRPPANVEPDTTQVLGGLGAPGAPPAARSRRKKSIMVGLVVAAALAVTVAVLAHVLGSPDSTGGGTSSGGGPTDVGRRIPIGSPVGDPQLIVPRAPRCGLTSYEGTTARGRLCVVTLTLLNPGGERVPLSRDPFTLLDDAGTPHTPEAPVAGLTDTLAPGGRLDRVLVYDLPPERRPARLSGQVTGGGRRIEVRL